jgi:multiple sugar transport system substrate-binding protein
LTWAAQAAEFNWKQAQGTEIRFLALRAWFTDHWKAQLPEFEKLTGIKVIIEDYPEDPFRQKLAVEMSAKSKDVDVFSTGTMREGRQFYTSGWYADLTPLVNDPTATSAEWDRNDFIEAVWKALQLDGKQLAVPVQSNVQIPPRRWRNWRPRPRSCTTRLRSTGSWPGAGRPRLPTPGPTGCTPTAGAG